MTGPTTRLLAGATLLASAAGIVLAAGTAQAGSGPATLTGTFTVTAGACTGGTVEGSWFRMILPSGSTKGPFVGNNDSACSDQTYTLLSPGSDGGLVTGGYQPEPTPAFDASGNSLAKRITAPVSFYGKKFSTDTAPKDPQTGAAVSAPTVTASGTALSGDLRAFGASWNTQEFNQGAPKPDGTKPGLTATPTGTYNAATGAYTLQWTSQIVGGPFNSFTGQWHLVGTFRPAGSSAPASARPSTPAPVSAATHAAAPHAAATATPDAAPTASRTAAPAVAATATVAATAPPSPATAPTASATATGEAAQAPPPATTSAAGSGGGQVVTTAATRSNAAHGWRAPVWAILLVTAIGVVGGAVYVALDRALRRSESS